MTGLRLRFLKIAVINIFAALCREEGFLLPCLATCSGTQGLYVRHAKGLSMEDINLKVLEYDFRFALVSDDVSGLNMEKIQFYPTEKMTRLYSGVTDKNIRKINIEEPVLDGIKVLD